MKNYFVLVPIIFSLLPDSALPMSRIDGILPLAHAHPTHHSVIALKRTLKSQQNLFSPLLPDGMVKIVFPNKKTTVITQDYAQRFRVVRDYLEFLPESKKRVVVLSTSSPSFVNESNFDNVSNYLEKKVILTDQITPAYELAGFLGAEKKILKKLAKAYITQVDESEYGAEYEQIKRHFGVKNFCKKFCKKLKSKGAVSLEHVMQKYFSMERNQCFGVEVSDVEKIRSLHDISYLNNFFGHYNNTTIDLSGNKIDSFDLEKINNLFPQVDTICFLDNAIKKLDLENINKATRKTKIILTDNPVNSIILSDKPPRSKCEIFMNENEDNSYNQHLINAVVPSARSTNRLITSDIILGISLASGLYFVPASVCAAALGMELCGLSSQVARKAAIKIACCEMSIIAAAIAYSFLLKMLCNTRNNDHKLVLLKKKNLTYSSIMQLYGRSWADRNIPNLHRIT